LENGTVLRRPLVIHDPAHRSRDEHSKKSQCNNYCPWSGEKRKEWDSNQRIHSIDRVKQELLNGSPDDDLVQWVGNEVPNTFFHSCGNQEIITAFGEVMLWAQRHPRFTDAAKAKFASGADGWLVAYSRVHQTTVVTNEERAPDSQKNIKLPDVCDAYGVETEGTFKMLELLGAQYHFSS
jgi:hypothetical protein